MIRLRKSVITLAILTLLSSCSTATKEVSNQEFNEKLKTLVENNKTNYELEYINKNGKIVVKTYSGIKEVLLYKYNYKDIILGSAENPFRIYLYPEKFFPSGASLRRTILCPNPKECTDITLSYIDVNLQFTPIKLPSSYYGLTPRDVSILSKSETPSPERLIYILKARKGLQKLYINGESKPVILTEKDRVNIIKTENKKECLYWSDSRDAYEKQDFRFAACFQNKIFISGDLATINSKLTKISRKVKLDPYPKKVILLTEKYKLSSYGLNYLTVNWNVSASQQGKLALNI
jgi:hypothetical protein